MAKVAVSIPHQLGQEEAKRRIGTLMRKIRTLGGTWSQRWTRDSCLSVQGQLAGHSVAGEVSVQERSVDATVTVPWMLALFTDRIRRSLEQAAREVLTAP
jgi:hypothetical protein